MIIKVKEQIEMEIVIEFPSFYKSTEKYCENKYYAFFSEKIGLCITDGFTYRVNPEGSMIDFKSLIPCEKSEIEPIFKNNQRFFDRTFNGITVDLNSNTSTEDLEQMQFERQSESVEMKHDFNK